MRACYRAHAIGLRRPTPAAIHRLQTSRNSFDSFFTQPPMRRMRICFTDVFPVLFVVCFSVRQKNTRQPFSGTAERIFMKRLPNDSGENVVSNVVPKWGLKTTQCALGGDAWRMTQKMSLCWSAGYDTVQLRRLRYKCMKE